MGRWNDELRKRSKAIDEKLATGRFSGAGEPNLAQGDMPTKKTLAEVVDPKTLALRFVVIKHVGNKQSIAAWTLTEQEADQTLRALESKDRITVDEFGEMQRTHYTKLQERLWHKTQV